MSCPGSALSACGAEACGVPTPMICRRSRSATRDAGISPRNAGRGWNPRVGLRRVRARAWLAGGQNELHRGALA